MATADPEPSSRPVDDIPWNDVTRFVRQLSHDLRNHLNAAELQSAYVGEIATDPELKDEIKRLRGMLSGLGAVLQKLSSDMGQARLSLIDYKASEFLEDLQSKIKSGSLEGSQEIQWEVQGEDATLQVDPQLLSLVIEELIQNAARHAPGKGSIRISTAIDGADAFVVSLIEPKEQTEWATDKWGHEPLRNITQAHYGLGLNRARTIVEAHGGRLEAHYDRSSKNLVTKIILPLGRNG